MFDITIWMKSYVARWYTYNNVSMVVVWVERLLKLWFWTVHYRLKSTWIVLSRILIPAVYLGSITIAWNVYGLVYRL